MSYLIDAFSVLSDLKELSSYLSEGELKELIDDLIAALNCLIASYLLLIIICRAFFILFAIFVGSVGVFTKKYVAIYLYIGLLVLSIIL